jgi:hypothetical protein
VFFRPYLVSHYCKKGKMEQLTFEQIELTPSGHGVNGILLLLTLILSWPVSLWGELPWIGWMSGIFQFVMSYFMYGVLIQQLTHWEGWNSSNETDRMVAYRIYTFVVISSCILPSFVSKPSYFFYYILQYTLLGNAFDLIRIGDVFTYLTSKYKAITPKDHMESYTVTSCSIEEYPYLMSVVAIILMYSIYYPLIVPAGVVLLSFKYVVDRYNTIPNHTPIDYTSNLEMVRNFYIFNIILFELTMIAHVLKSIGFYSYHHFLLEIWFLFTCCIFSIWTTPMKHSNHDSTPIYTVLDQDTVDLAFKEEPFY